MSAYNIPGSGHPAMTAGYLADGMRAWKEDSSNNRTYYLYDETAPLAELNTTDRLITFVTFGPNGLISRRKGTNSTFYTYDFTGSVATATDGNGNVLGDVALNAVGVRESALPRPKCHERQRILAAPVQRDGRVGQCPPPPAHTGTCSSRHSKSPITADYRPINFARSSRT